MVKKQKKYLTLTNIFSKLNPVQALVICARNLNPFLLIRLYFHDGMAKYWYCPTQGPARFFI
jgi:hypothetical protein